VVAVLVALPLDYTPVVVRADPLTCLDGRSTSARFCVYPEEVGAAEEVVPVADALLSRVGTATGAELPVVVSQRPEGGTERLMDSLAVSGSARDRGVVLATHAGFPPLSDPCFDQVVETYAAVEGFETTGALDLVAGAWWSTWTRALDAAPDDAPAAAARLAAESSVDPVARQALGRLVALDPADQGRWVNAARRAADTCDVGEMSRLMHEVLA